MRTYSSEGSSICLKELKGKKVETPSTKALETRLGDGPTSGLPTQHRANYVVITPPPSLFTDSEVNITITGASITVFCFR